jgi:hypothetical protein
MATYHMFTGTADAGACTGYRRGGLARLGRKNNLPAWVGVPNVPASVGTGYLSANSAPSNGRGPGQRNFQVRDIALPRA